ncbi:GntR family transcriptional regulator [Marivita sp. GX14005]|uniref:GntR family transcriptional regulator n=1 Tax=Marivita sp. GX14005 TaxID=2942276 RepID=UPI00201A1B99|nr:GntR family transcriptional regulator [Marivita sp. GX14005]MCL3881326.1 GntR family transcriptional regulator [Marivita sp. GX14005]
MVYRQLRDQVLFGELEPGQPITIKGLTEALGVGMTPVREALRRLTAAGALEFMGNRRIVVPVLDSAAVGELTVARKALEPELARRAALRVQPSDIARLTETDLRLDHAIGRGDVGRYLIENHRFHCELNAIARSPILTETVDRLWLRFGPSLRVVCGRIGTRNLPDRHKDILDALRAGNPSAAATAMAADVEQGMAQIGDALR